MTDKTPLTRSPQLTPLSHEHYDGLLFVWRIRQGIRREASIPTMNEYIRWFWQNHLQSHFENEEKILVPHLPAGDTLIQRMLQEHQAIRQLIPGDIDLPLVKVSLLARLLHDHIRYEERDLFPHIENKVAPAELEDIARNLPERSCSSEWKIEFWKD
jgi:hemerythrin-like domain-containing protein